MVREIHYYECSSCEEQYGSWAEAENCEWGHEMKEEANR